MDGNNPYINEAVIINQLDVFALENANNPDPATNDTVISATVFAKEVQIVEDIGVNSAKSFAKLHPGSPAGTLSLDRVVRCTPINGDYINKVCAYYYTPGVPNKTNVGAVANPSVAADVKMILLANNTYRVKVVVEQGSTDFFPAGTPLTFELMFRSGVATPTDQQVAQGLLDNLNSGNNPLAQWVSGAVVLLAGKYYLQLTGKIIGVNYNLIVTLAEGFGMPSKTVSVSGDTYYGENQVALDEIGGSDYMNQMMNTVIGYTKVVGVPGEQSQYQAPTKWLPGRKYGIIHIQHYKKSGDGMNNFDRIINLFIAFELSSGAKDPWTAVADYVWGNGLATGANFDGGIRAGSAGSNANTSLRAWLNAVNPQWLPETSNKIFGV